MRNDPFGSLNDWGTVLVLLEALAENDQLEDCQPGLIRVLQYKGNWQLREEVLKRVGEIQSPTDKLVFQVLSIMGDDNIYYDVRILATEALIPLLKRVQDNSRGEINREAQKVVQKLKSTPQPPFLNDALDRLCSEVDFLRMIM